MNTTNQPNVKFVQTPTTAKLMPTACKFGSMSGFFPGLRHHAAKYGNAGGTAKLSGIYLSPQQAKALMALMQQNVSNYEAAFGEIKLDPRAPADRFTDAPFNNGCATHGAVGWDREISPGIFRVDRAVASIRAVLRRIDASACAASAPSLFLG